MFSGEVPERPAGPGPRGEGRRDRVLHHRGGGMIEFGDAFLALNVIPQAATTGARGRRHAADRQPWDVRKEFIVSARRAPRRHPVCTTLLRTEAQAGPQAINQIRVAAGFRARAQLQAVQGREPAKPGRSRVVSRQPKTNIWDARRRGPAGKSGVQDAVTRRPAPHARGGRVVYDRVHYPRDRRVDAPTLGRYSEPSFFLDGVPPVVVRLARQREPPPTWEQGWQPREVADATAGTLRWARA